MLSPLQTSTRVSGTLVIAAALTVGSAALSDGVRAQSTADAFQTGITGSAPSGPSNPTTMMNDAAVRRLILRLAERAVPLAEAEESLGGGSYTVTSLVEAGLARVDGGSVHIALNYVSADDQRLIASKARGYGREIADLVLERRAELMAAVAPLADTEDEKRAILYFLVGCMALDWDGLGFTESAEFRAGATVTGPGFAYTPWMKENAPDTSRRGLYWGSHNRPLGDYTFTTFGDHEAVPRVALPDLFFSVANPFSSLETPEGATAARRLFGSYSGAILTDIASVLVAIHDGATSAPAIEAATGVAPANVTAILALLEPIHYVTSEPGGLFRLEVTVLKSDAKPAAERVVGIVRDVMDRWHQRRYAEVRRELGGLTGLERGIPFEVVYTEIWHYIFGYANLFLAEKGLLADPYAEGAPFRGFLPFLWDSSIDASS